MAKKKPAKLKRITKKAVQATENKPFVLPDVRVKPEIDQDAFEADGLTHRQRVFVDALVGPAGGVASKAAEMAGYASDNDNALRVTASRLLTKANVQEAIARAYAARRMTDEWAEFAAHDMAGASMANFLSVGDDGKPAFDWEKAASAGAIGHVREYKEEGIEGGGGDGPAIIKRSFKLYDKQKAIETVLKLRGLLKETVKHEGEVRFGRITMDGGKEVAGE